MENSKKGLADLQVLGDVELQGIVGGAILKASQYEPVANVNGVSLDTKQLKFLARSNLAGVVGVPC